MTHKLFFKSFWTGRDDEINFNSSFQSCSMPDFVSGGGGGWIPWLPNELPKKKKGLHHLWLIAPLYRSLRTEIPPPAYAPSFFDSLA